MDIRTLQSALARLAADHADDPLQQPKNIALSLGADAGLLLSLFRGLTERQGLEDDLAREAAADALASILIHVAQLSNHVGLDASAALRARIKGKSAPPLAPIGQLPPAVIEAAAAFKGNDAIAAEPVPVDAAPAERAPVDAAPAERAEAAEPPAAPSAAKSSAASPTSAPVNEPTSAPVTAPTSAPTTAPAAEPPPAAKPASRKRGAPQIITVDVGGPPMAAPAAAATVEVISVEDAPSPASGPTAVPRSQPVPAADPHDHIDAEQVLEMTKAFARQLERSTRDDPVLRDLRDELETLRRSLYAPNAKKAWIAGSLQSLRSHLEDALSHAFAEEVRAQEYIGRIDALLAH